jgi:D-sedoheptulose 7-phosphate isomerase
MWLSVAATGHREPLLQTTGYERALTCGPAVWKMPNRIAVASPGICPMGDRNTSQPGAPAEDAGALGEDIRRSIASRRAAMDALRDSADVVARIAQTVAAALARGGKVLACGNGGSAAEAMHLTEEMIGRFSRDRAALAAISLSADPTALTCIANDFGFEAVFARQVAALGTKGDVLVALSTSGKSPNVLKALETARQKGLTTIGLLGRPGSPAEALCDIAFTAHVDTSAHVQELHLAVIHLVLEQLDRSAP